MFGVNRPALLMAQLHTFPLLHQSLLDGCSAMSSQSPAQRKPRPYFLGYSTAGTNTDTISSGADLKRHVKRIFKSLKRASAGFQRLGQKFRERAGGRRRRD